MGQNFRIKEHIGKNISTVNAKEYLKTNFDRIAREEFDIRKGFLDNLDLVHNKNLLDYVELKSIEVNNLFEIKDIKDVVLVEFAKDFINAKLLAHRYELQGHVDIVDKTKTLIEIDFEGFYLEFTVEAVHDSLQDFRNNFGARHLRKYFKDLDNKSFILLNKN